MEYLDFMGQIHSGLMYICNIASLKLVEQKFTAFASTLLYTFILPSQIIDISMYLVYFLQFCPNFYKQNHILSFRR